MWNKLTKKQLALIPDMYSGEGVPVEDKKIYAKFFMGGWTWYIAEIDHNNNDRMFGYVVSPLAPQGEWGYISLSELINLRQGYMEVDREIHGIAPRSPKRFGDIRGIN